MTDDWTNPQRPKPELMREELELMLRHALGQGRVGSGEVPALRRWFDLSHGYMTRYRPNHDDPRKFEQLFLEVPRAELRWAMATAAGNYRNSPQVVPGS